MQLSYLGLLILTVGLSIYDWRTRRVPNRITLLLLTTGVVLHFPGQLETWLGCLVLFSTWREGVLGGGDAKLWMALLWLTPPAYALESLLLMGGSWFATGLVQIAHRRARRRALIGRRSPGVWRTVPFVLWLVAIG